MITIRIFGDCPNCNTADTLLRRWIEETNRQIVVCELCGMTGLDLYEKPWCRLFVGWNGVMLESSSEIPHLRLVTRILNTAVANRFKLAFAISPEGGLCGAVGTDYVEISNCSDGILGLMDDMEYGEYSQLSMVLNWYADILQLLAINELTFGGINYGTGQLLKIKESDSSSAADIQLLLWAAIAKKAHSREFARRVFERVRVQRLTLEARYIAGLTSSEVQEAFVPPPEVG